MHRGTALALASFLGFGALLVLFGANSTEILDDLGLDYAAFGLVGSMLSLGLGIGIVGAGPLIDRYPRRPLYVAACLVVVAATTTLGPGTSYSRLLLHTLAIGLGAGFYETVLNALVVEEFSTRAPRRLVFIHSAATLAASATPLLFESLRALGPIAWHETFGLVGLSHLALVAAAFFVPMPPSPRRAAGPPLAVGAREAASTVDSDGVAPRREPGGARPEAAPRDDRLALASICLAAFAYVGVESALTLFVADHATRELGLDAARAAGTISAFWGGLLVGRLAIGLSPRAPGAGTTAALASVASGVVLLFGLGLIGPPELAMAAVGFFLGGVFPIMIGLAGIALPSSAGTAVGLAGGLGSLGGFVIPWVTGRVANAASLSLALASLGAWLGLLVASAAYARRRTGAGTPGS